MAKPCKMESSAFSEDSPQFFKIFSPENCSQKMRIPPEFTKNFKNTKPFKSMLRTSDERSWEVDVIKDGKYLFFKNGWQEFVRYYSLEDGDFLLFYYSANALFDVTVFGLDCRPKQLPTCTASKDIEENIQAPETAVNSNNPSFEIVLKSTYITRKFMTLPVQFWKEYMHEDRDTAKLNLSDKSWEVALVRYPYRNSFTTGWANFVADNHLRKNFICKFELISTDDYVFNVTFRKSDSKSRSTGRPKKLPTRTNEAPAVNSNKPSFEKVLTSTYVTRYMSVPKKFWKIYMLEDLTVKLVYSDKSWEVKFQSDTQRFTAGWPKFVTDNKLGENFICRFELISATDFVFNVTVREPGRKSKGKSKQI